MRRGPALFSLGFVALTLPGAAHRASEDPIPPTATATVAGKAQRFSGTGEFVHTRRRFSSPEDNG